MGEVAKKTIITVGCVILMCCAVLSAIFYAEGYYDFTFISRQEGEETKRPVPSDTDIPEETGKTDTDTDVNGNTSQGETQAPIEIPDINSFLNSGYKVSSDLFNKEKDVIAKLDISLPSKYVYSTALKPKTVISYKPDGIERVFEKTKTEQNLYSVELYMGYIVVSDGDTTVIYNSDGTVAVERFEGTLGEFIYKYDESGKGIFTLEGESYVIENGAFVPAGKILDNGFAYNASSTVGKTDSYYAFEADDGKWGYKNGDGKIEFAAKYDKTYNFTNGLGMVCNEGGIFYFNERGSRKCTGYSQIGTNDLYSAGAIYFDGGLVMVRSVTYERHDVIMDRDILVDVNGNEYEIPNGCELISYSNQRILLKKNGKYGFYAVKNDWITDINTYTYAQPYCEGLAVVGTENGSKGVIDLDGNVVVPFEYSHITECCNGVFAAYSQSSGWTVFSKLTLNA